MESRFANNLPSNAWVKNFITITPELSERLCENIKRLRAAVTHEIVREYFENVPYMENTAPKFTINYDETAISNDPGREKVVVRKGAKYAERIIDQAKTNVSVMFAITAHVEMLPHMSATKANTYMTHGVKADQKAQNIIIPKAGASIHAFLQTGLNELLYRIIERWTPKTSLRKSL